MPSQTTNTYFHLPTTWLSGLLTDWYGFKTFNTPREAIPWALTSFDGTPGLEGEYSTTGPFTTTTTHRVLLKGWTEETVVPCRTLASIPGMSLTITGATGEPDVDAYNAVVDSWDNLMDQLCLFFEAMTDATTVTMLERHSEYFDDTTAYEIQSVIRFFCADGSVVYNVLGISSSGSVSVFGIDAVTTVEVGDGVATASAAALCIGTPDTNRIADALEVISLNDVEVSINHGAAAWSVTGKVRTG